MTLSREIAEAMAKKNISVEVLTETLRSYKLLSLLPSIKRDLEKLSRDESEWDKIHIESPYALNEEALTSIKRIVGNDLAATEVTLTKELLAGFRARWKGKMYDGSAQRIIKQLLHKQTAF